MNGIVYQLNVKSRIERERGIPKLPVENAYLSQQGLSDDFNVYRTEKKGGTLDRAVLIIPLETIKQLNTENWTIKPGDLGENITTEGIPYDAFNIGTRWQIGQAIIEISEICRPCKNLRVLPSVGYKKIIPFISTLVGRRGLYARVLKEGDIYQGMAINSCIAS